MSEHHASSTHKIYLFTFLLHIICVQYLAYEFTPSRSSLRAILLFILHVLVHDQQTMLALGSIRSSSGLSRFEDRPEELQLMRQLLQSAKIALPTWTPVVT
jgi:hypothetical protein